MSDLLQRYMDKMHERMECDMRTNLFDPKPTFLPLMRRPCRSVERESAEANAKAILDKTCAELRLKNNG